VGASPVLRRGSSEEMSCFSGIGVFYVLECFVEEGAYGKRRFRNVDRKKAELRQIVMLL
jgi:hypothetical protein